MATGPEDRKDFANAWRRLLLEVELSRNYPGVFAIYGLGATHHDPLLDYLLPSLLYLKLVAVLDEGFVLLMLERGLTLPQKYRDSLHGRIEFLADQTLISNKGALLAIKEVRNAIAHDLRQKATWDQLARGQEVVERTLQDLGFIGPRPRLEFYAEKDAAQPSTEPGVLFTEDYRYGLTENGKRAIKVSSQTKILDE